MWLWLDKMNQNGTLVNGTKDAKSAVYPGSLILSHTHVGHRTLVWIHVHKPPLSRSQLLGGMLQLSDLAEHPSSVANSAPLLKASLLVVQWKTAFVGNKLKP